MDRWKVNLYHDIVILIGLPQIFSQGLVECNVKILLLFFRYFIQAEDQLDCNWLFMIGQEGDLSKWTEWLGTQL